MLLTFALAAVRIGPFPTAIFSFLGDTPVPVCAGPAFFLILSLEMPRVSVIIPTLNEEKVLAATLQRVFLQDALEEIIVVDAESKDQTLAIAAKYSVRSMLSPVHDRAMQMNLGARSSTGDILLFLHADTWLPPGALAQVAAALGDPKIVGGAFVRKFASRSRFLKATCLLAELRNRVIGWHLGDQAIFCRRAVFDSVHGFKRMSPFEDLDFSRRIGQLGRLATLRPPVVSSARRFAQGPASRTWKDLKLTIGYILSNRHPLRSDLLASP